MTGHGGSERRSLDILSVKKRKQFKRSAIEVAADEEGKGEADMRFKSLLTVCQRRHGLSMMKRPVWKNIVFLASRMR